MSKNIVRLVLIVSFAFSFRMNAYSSEFLKIIPGTKEPFWDNNESFYIPSLHKICKAKNNSSIVVFDLDNEELNYLSNEDTFDHINSIALSNNGKYVVNPLFNLFDLENNQFLDKINIDHYRYDNIGFINDDKSILFSYTTNETSIYTIYDIEKKTTKSFANSKPYFNIDISNGNCYVFFNNYDLCKLNDNNEFVLVKNLKKVYKMSSGMEDYVNIRISPNESHLFIEHLGNFFIFSMDNFKELIHYYHIQQLPEFLIEKNLMLTTNGGNLIIKNLNNLTDSEEIDLHFTQRIYSVKFINENEFLIDFIDNSTVIYNKITGISRLVFNSGYIYTADINSNGETVVLASESTNIKIFLYNKELNLKQLFKLSKQKSSSSYHFYYYFVKYINENQIIFPIGGESYNKLAIYDSKTDKILKSSYEFSDILTDIEFFNDNNQAVVTSLNGSIYQINLNDLTVEKELSLNTNEKNFGPTQISKINNNQCKIIFSKLNEKGIDDSDTDGVITLNINNFSIIDENTFKYYTFFEDAYRFGLDQKYIYSYDNGSLYYNDKRMLDKVNLETHYRENSITFKDIITSIDLSEDGKYLAVGTLKNTKIIDIETFTIIDSTQNYPMETFYENKESELYHNLVKFFPNSNKLLIGDTQSSLLVSSFDPTSVIDLTYDTELTVYPNPADDFILLSDNKEVDNYEIFSLNGNLVKNDQLISNKIDITNFSKGIYFINYYNANNELIKKSKFVKK